MLVDLFTQYAEKILTVHSKANCMTSSFVNQELSMNVSLFGLAGAANTSDSVSTLVKTSSEIFNVEKLLADVVHHDSISSDNMY